MNYKIKRSSIFNNGPKIKWYTRSKKDYQFTTRPPPEQSGFTYKMSKTFLDDDEDEEYNKPGDEDKDQDQDQDNTTPENPAPSAPPESTIEEEEAEEEAKEYKGQNIEEEEEGESEAMEVEPGSEEEVEEEKELKEAEDEAKQHLPELKQRTFKEHLEDMFPEYAASTDRVKTDMEIQLSNILTKYNLWDNKAELGRLLKEMLPITTQKHEGWRGYNFQSDAYKKDPLYEKLDAENKKNLDKYIYDSNKEGKLISDYEYRELMAAYLQIQNVRKKK